MKRIRYFGKKVLKTENALFNETRQGIRKFEGRNEKRALNNFHVLSEIINRLYGQKFAAQLFAQTKFFMVDKE